MGKNLPQQRRGKGSPRYRPPSHRYLGDVRYEFNIGANVSGKIENIVHAPGRFTPLALVDFGGQKKLMIPPEGSVVGQTISYGGDVNTGNIIELSKVPEGQKIYNIELSPGDGGKVCRSPGSFGLMVTRGERECVVKLPSKKLVTLNSNCRATVGVPAGQGKKDKPMLKAGAAFYKWRALGKLWPKTKAVAKNPVDHPFGGKTKPGKPKTMSRDAPPGQKAGSVSARRTGKKKK